MAVSILESSAPEQFLTSDSYVHITDNELTRKLLSMLESFTGRLWQLFLSVLLLHLRHVVLDSTQFDGVTIGVKDTVSCAGVSITGLTNATRVDDQATVDRGLMLHVRVAKDDSRVVVKVRPHSRKIMWENVPAEVVGVRVTVYE